ncbi:MAG: class A beta-lactamase [Akkermansiaceae bacterium]|nr:class A beta-lactamase [Armatimonadota bacterium]
MAVYSRRYNPWHMATLIEKLKTLADGFDGRVGIGMQSAAGLVTVRGGERFSLQSVMKLMVAAAVMDAVDRRGWRLDTPILVRREDLSLYVQPIADRVTKNGYRTTLGDLVFRAVVDSDSAATDIAFARVGGAAAIRAFLARCGANGIRVDRDERHLQTEIVGLTWRPEYVDAAVLEKAIQAVPTAVRDHAFQAYRRDPRDTATPAGMASFLYNLASGKLLSPGSTRHLLSVMRRTATGPDRLKAGVPKGWTLAHKTGTSGTYKGVTMATNDVGVLTTPDGRNIAVAVFVAESHRSPKERAALIADVARIAATHYKTATR